MTGFNINTLNSFIQGRHDEVKNFILWKVQSQATLPESGDEVNIVKLTNRPKENEMPTRS